MYVVSQHRYKTTTTIELQNEHKDDYKPIIRISFVTTLKKWVFQNNSYLYVF